MEHGGEFLFVLGGRGLLGGLGSDWIEAGGAGSLGKGLGPLGGGMRAGGLGLGLS